MHVFLLPRFRTKYCRSGATCRRWNCFFAHSVEELRDPQAASAAAATDGSDARASSLDTFSFGALEDSLPLLPTFSKHPHTAVGSSLGSFLPSSAGLSTFTSASSGLCLPLLGPLPDMAGAAAAGSNGGFLGLECSKSLVSSGSQSPGGSSSAMHSGSFSSCGVPSGGLLNGAINSSAMLSTSSGTLFNHDGLMTATSSCPVTMAPPAVTSAAFDHLLPADQQSQWLLQPGLLPAHMQWYEPQQAWQQQQQQQQQQAGRVEYPQHMQQQAPLSADQMAFQQLLAAPGGPMDTKKSDMLHVMAMALGMDLHALRQSS